MASESITYEFGETLSETLEIQEKEEIPERANKHVPIVEGFLSDPRKIFNLSISSLFNLEIGLCGFPSLLRCVLTTCACPHSFSVLLEKFLFMFRGRPLSFQQVSLV